jgi:hypothetical protein
MSRESWIRMASPGRSGGMSLKIASEPVNDLRHSGDHFL